MADICSVRVLIVLVSALSLAMTGSSFVLGGYKQADHENDSRVQEVAQFAVQKVNEVESLAENEILQLVKVLSVHRQVVAGVNYRLVVEAATPAQQPAFYELSVFEPLGQQDLQLTGHKAINKAQAMQSREAESERDSGALLGGSKELSAEDPEVQQAAQHAVEQLNSQSNSLIPFELSKVVKASSRVAAGTVYNLTMEVKRGDRETKIMEVEVARSLKNEYSLQKTADVQVVS